MVTLAQIQVKRAAIAAAQAIYSKYPAVVRLYIKYSIGSHTPYIRAGTLPTLSEILALLPSHEHAAFLAAWHAM